MEELVNCYVKCSAQNKGLVPKIGSEILELSREVAKKYLCVGEDVCMFYVAQIYPIVSTELIHWNKIVCRRMKPMTSLYLPCKVKFTTRNMRLEILFLLKQNCNKRPVKTTTKKGYWDEFERTS